ncbi:MAG: YcgN family cysteine cluster protein [Deltaproteobacteria bacterium]|nr:YcgN family cysteine cluster protein [Deltaproteobacteria bacterium]
MGEKERHFWKEKTLEEMDDKEWELLCDQCGICCLFKLEDEDSGKLYYTRVTCRLLNMKNATCTRYPDRTKLIPLCIPLSIKDPDKFSLLPKTCAYRRLYEGKRLLPWHPLITGRKQSVQEAGFSIINKTISEKKIKRGQITDYIVEEEITSFFKRMLE